MTEHYFTEKPTSELKIYSIKFNIRNKDVELFTASGVFSPKSIDTGSDIFLKKCIINDNWKVLDLGCGYGVVGISLKLLFPSIDLTLSDINERALDITRKNLKKYNLKANVIKSNSFDNIKNKFDTILLNPPQTAGKQLCFKMINVKEITKTAGFRVYVSKNYKF
ncbi:MAG: methyltransferase small [archaeon GW2011_AR18]|nr:MAG: methyltransferase small [archaeon GW2011_AR18]